MTPVYLFGSKTYFTYQQYLTWHIRDFIVGATLGNKKDVGSDINPPSWTELFTSEMSVTMHYIRVGKN